MNNAIRSMRLHRTGKAERKIDNSQRSQVVVQSAEHSRESSTLSFVVECMTNFKIRGDSFGPATLIRLMGNRREPVDAADRGGP